ncbi:MAG TPA: alpha/beta hydrolase [Chloroflexia bacterium]
MADDPQIVYTLPGMDTVPVRKDIVYKSVDGESLMLDVYTPPGAEPGARRPAVLFVHGDGPPDMLRHAKDWGVFTGWGRLAALSGLVGITFNHRSTAGWTKLPDVAGDIADLIAFVRREAPDLGLDADRLGVLVASAGGPAGLAPLLRDPPPFLRALVAYYTVMDLQGLHAHVELPPHVTPDLLREFSPVAQVPAGPESCPPLLIARAGLDRATINASIDAFIQAALAHNLDLDVMNHPTGRHGFDVLDADARSREIIRRTLAFLTQHLDPAA